MHKRHASNGFTGKASLKKVLWEQYFKTHDGSQWHGNKSQEHGAGVYPFVTSWACHCTTGLTMSGEQTCKILQQAGMFNWFNSFNGCQMAKVMRKAWGQRTKAQRSPIDLRGFLKLMASYWIRILIVIPACFTDMHEPLSCHILAMHKM